jgi:hypothetical protein
LTEICIRDILHKIKLLDKKADLRLFAVVLKNVRQNNVIKKAKAAGLNVLPFRIDIKEQELKEAIKGLIKLLTEFKASL